MLFGFSLSLPLFLPQTIAKVAYVVSAEGAKRLKSLASTEEIYAPIDNMVLIVMNMFTLFAERCHEVV